MDDHLRTRAPLPALVAVLALGAFTTAINVTMLSPLLTAIAADFHVTAAAAGQLATVTATCAGLTGLAIAPVLDRYPRGHVLGAEAALLGAGTLLTIVAPSFGWLFAGRALAGFGGAIIFGISLATVGDLFPASHARNRIIGLVSTAATLGGVVGLPLITALNAWLGWRWAMAALLPPVAVLLAGSFFFPHRTSASQGRVWTTWRSGYATVGRSRPSVILLAFMVTVSLVWFGWLIYFGAYAQDSFDVSPRLLSVIFLSGGLAEVAGNNIVPPLLHRFPAGRVIAVAALVTSANLLATGPFYRQRWTLFPFFIIGSLAIVVLFLASSIALLDSLPRARGALMALQSAGFEFGGALGAGVTGLALHTFGGYSAAYALLGAILPLSLVLLWRAQRGPAAAPAPG